MMKTDLFFANDLVLLLLALLHETKTATEGQAEFVLSVALSQDAHSEHPGSCLCGTRDKLPATSLMV